MRRLSALFCAAILGSAWFLSGCQYATQTADTKPEPAPVATEIVLDEKLTAEMVDCQIKGDLLRIESINPSLDDYDLTVTLYSLAQKKVLCRLPLGKDSWNTGWTENGFYAVALNKRTIYLYDEKGTLVEERVFPSQIKQVSFLMMNPVGTAYFIGSGKEGRLYLYDVAKKSHRDVGQMLFGYAKPLTYQDGYFYLEGETDLLRIKEDGNYAETAYCQLGAMTKFPEMGICIDENTLQVIRPDVEGALHFEKKCANPAPLTTDGNRFAISDGDKTVYVYSLSSDKIHTLRFDQPVEGAVFYKDWLLVNTKSKEYHQLILTAIDAVIPQQASTHSATSTTTTTTTTTTTSATSGTTSSTASGTTTSATSGTTSSTTSSTTSTRVNKSSHKIEGVPVIAQKPNYPTGCESISAIMVLKYWGEKITIDHFIDRHLPKSAYFYTKNGVNYGPNPYEFFVGNPRTEQSYGCMAPVIERALVDYFGSGERVVNATGASLEELCKTYIDKDLPVLLWVTIGMLDTYSSAKWRLDDGSLFEWPANEHCMVLVGYDRNYYYFNDPYTGTAKRYAKWLVERRYKEMGTQAIVITE
ncbi:MAG: hypothetical protein E7527_00465 [Ruminococcaceae bacterium]|nr:hypothetical protein [Oscillospiraceae bacterium]